MKNFLLGALCALSISSFAIEHMQDGSIVLDRDDVKRIEIQWYQMNQNFMMCVQRVNELSEQLEVVTKAKCT